MICPHCLFKQATVGPFGLNLDFRRRTRALESLASGQEIQNQPNLDVSNEEQRKVNVEIDEVIWETTAYKTFEIKDPLQTREAADFAMRPDTWQQLNPQLYGDCYYWVIRRPFDLPIMTNYDKFLSLVTDPVQRKILSDGLKQADIPEPAQRYLKALGEGQIDDELYENFLPREEVVADTIEI